MNLILVVGQFRSGASALCAGLNSVGIPMGTEFAAPVPPRMRLEYEDLAFARLLLKYMPIWKSADLDSQTEGRLQRELVIYFSERVRVHHAQFDALGSSPKAIGAKCGLMAPALDIVVDAAKTARLSPFVVFVNRAQDEIDASMQECLLPFVGARAKHWVLRQEAIRCSMEAKAGTADATVQYRRGMIEANPMDLVTRANERRTAWQQH